MHKTLHVQPILILISPKGIRTSPVPRPSSSVPPLCFPVPRRESTALTWAWISFQTIYGELVPLEDNSDVTGLAMFILNRLLWNPDIAAEYRHPSVPHLYRDGGWLCLRRVLPTLCAEGILSSFLSLFRLHLPEKLV